METKPPSSRYGRLLSYARGQWVGLSVVIALTGVMALVGAAQPWPMKILVDYGLRHDPVPPGLRSLTMWLKVQPSSRSFVLLAGLASLGLFAISAVVNTILTWVWSMVGRKMTTALSADLFGRLQRRSLLLHNKSSVGDSLTRINSDAWCVMDLTSNLIISPVQNVLSLILLGVASWRLNREVAVLTVVLAPLLVCSSRFFGKKMKRRAKRSREAQARLVSFVQQTLSAIPVVQAFGREDFNRRRFGDLAEEAVESSQQRVIVGSSYGMVNGLISTTGLAIVLYVGGQRVLAGALSVGGLLVFVSYMKGLQSVSDGLVGLYGSLKPVEASVDRVLEILDAVAAVPERPGAPALSAEDRKSGRRVCFEDVTFGYEPGHPVIEHVNIEVAPGRTVALVGQTGAGKSTLASLIPRFFDPWSGRVTFDGVDIRDLQLASVRQQVALVLQEPFILPISIAENIAYGKPEASRHDILEAAKAANAHEFIERLPEGYDTMVGERGATLSGGEKQRLSIARALLKNAPILILDEPTSAVDAATEASLVQTLKWLMAGRTTLIIGHRLSTLRHADEIIVLEQGRIAERGTHERLMQAGGLYQRYYSMQFLEQSMGVGA